ncbi:hypothetical protein ACJX0J_027824, partial [Zea mays]
TKFLKDFSEISGKNIPLLQRLQSDWAYFKMKGVFWNCDGNSTLNLFGIFLLRNKEDGIHRMGTEYGGNTAIERWHHQKKLSGVVRMIKFAGRLAKREGQISGVLLNEEGIFALLRMERLKFWEDNTNTR